MPQHMHDLPYYKHPPPEWNILTSDEPGLTHHSHPESIIYISVHFWCCTLCGFGKCLVICIHHYSNHAEYFNCLKCPLCLFIYFSHLLNPLKLLIFLRSLYFCFFKMSYMWNHSVSSY